MKLAVIVRPSPPWLRQIRVITVCLMSVSVFMYVFVRLLSPHRKMLNTCVGACKCAHVLMYLAEECASYSR